MNIADYFAEDRDEFLKPTPATGERTDWLDFCELELKGSNILIVDTQFVPSEKDGLLVALSAGKYTIQAKTVNYGGDRRVSRLRAFQAGTNPKLGEEIGKTWTDTAMTGICDFETFSKAWGNDNHASYAVIEPFFESGEDFGVAVFDAASGAVMPFVHSGFGDGNFPVLELLAARKRVGFEIVFIAGDEEYSFGETPYQTYCRVGEIGIKAARGDVAAQLQLGKMHQSGKEVEKNLETAANWFEKAAQNGSVEATLKLGAIYKAGKGRPQDLGRAKELFEFAAAKGSASALNELGILYRHGHGVAVDYDKAVAFYRQAADLGFANAQYNLGVNFSKGWGVPKDITEAAKWFRMAADQGNLNAIFNLGLLHLRGEGLPKNEKEAVRWFNLGAQSRHAMCANNLGYCYANGIGLEKNLKKARNFYHIAALENLAVAQKNLGVLLKQGGDGVEKDLNCALKWLNRSVEAGNAEAHYELGLLYETGEGVAVDKVEACKLYQKAVDGGFAKAAEKLRELFASLSEIERAAILGNKK